MRSRPEVRVVGAVAGLGLALGGIVLGSFLSARHRDASDDDAPDYTGRRSRGDLDQVGRTVTIRKPRSELYAFWRNFPNLTQVMENVETIVPKGDGGDRSIWTIKAPGGTSVDVETEVSEDKPDELIAWRSVEGSDITTRGRVEFRDAPGERGTRVTLVIAYDPPGGQVGKAVAKLFMREPAMQARHDLKRFKMLMETGEIATSVRRKDQTRAAKQQENG